MRSLTATAIVALVLAGAVIALPRRIVHNLVHHDDHMHVRFRARRGGRTG